MPKGISITNAIIKVNLYRKSRCINDLKLKIHLNNRFKNICFLLIENTLILFYKKESANGVRETLAVCEGNGIKHKENIWAKLTDFFNFQAGG